jgi:hypothetical protein
MERRNDPLLDELRAADPARELDFDRAVRTPRAQRAFLSIVSRDGPWHRRRLSRRGFVTMVAAATVALSAVGAVASGLFSPDPQDVQGILDASAEHTDVHLPGWRPVLNSETVWCLYDNGHSVSTTASGFPLDETLTVDRLISECRTNDVARMVGVPDELTICDGVQANAVIDQQLAGGRIVSGDADSRPAFPVVLGWDADCATAEVSGLRQLQLRDFTGIEAINRWREVEVRLDSFGIDRCLRRTEAIQVATEAAEALGDGWFVFEPEHDQDDLCRRVDLDPMLGAVVIWPA